MPGSAARLTLMVPGLFGPESPTPADAARVMHAVVEGLDLSGLSRLLSCADALGPEPHTDSSLEGMLFSAFELSQSDNRDWPVAAVTGLEDGAAADGWWMRADPVYLAPDGGDLVLGDPDALRITAEEADALTGEINATLGDDEFRIQPLAPTRWYVHLDRWADISTHSPSASMHRSVGARLPSGPAYRHWHRLLNEVQMVLHDAEANRAREARGELPVNSVWLWGGGALPACAGGSWARVWGSGALLAGLARLAGCPHSPPPPDADRWIEHAEVGEHLIMIDRAHRLASASALEEWRECLSSLEEQWFEPLRGGLRSRRVSELMIRLDAPYRFRVSSRGIGRWWRRTRPFAWFAGEYRR